MARHDALVPRLLNSPADTLIEHDVRDRGGRKLKGGTWRVFTFEVEVAVESPKNVDEDEAAEDAADFMETVRKTMGRINESFASVTHVRELPPAEKYREQSIEEAMSRRTKKKAEPVIAQAYEDAVPTVLTDKPSNGKIKRTVKKAKPQKAMPKVKKI